MKKEGRAGEITEIWSKVRKKYKIKSLKDGCVG